MAEMTIVCRLKIPLREGETPEAALDRANTYLSGGYELVMQQFAGFDLDRYDVGRPSLELYAPRNPELEGDEHGVGQD